MAEYPNDKPLVPWDSSGTGSRDSAGGGKAARKRPAASQSEPARGTPKAQVDGSSASPSLVQLVKTANLAEADASEEDKIAAMMIQSCQQYRAVDSVKKCWGPPPPSYICFRCGKPGHYRRDCPTNGDKGFEPVRRIKKSTGIPSTFLVEVKDPSTKGTMVTSTGKYVIPSVNVEAYARGKKEKCPFPCDEPSSSSSSSSDAPIPEWLCCPICREILNDAAIIPCCGNSYCDECIRTALLESEGHACPTCQRAGVSPDALVANKALRKLVNRFNSGTSHGKWPCH